MRIIYRTNPRGATTPSQEIFNVWRRDLSNGGYFTASISRSNERLYSNVSEGITLYSVATGNYAVRTGDIIGFTAYVPSTLRFFLSDDPAADSIYRDDTNSVLNFDKGFLPLITASVNPFSDVTCTRNENLPPSTTAVPISPPTTTAPISPTTSPLSSSTIPAPSLSTTPVPNTLPTPTVSIVIVTLVTTASANYQEIVVIVGVLCGVVVVFLMGLHLALCVAFLVRRAAKKRDSVASTEQPSVELREIHVYAETRPAHSKETDGDDSSLCSNAAYVKENYGHGENNTLRLEHGLEDNYEPSDFSRVKEGTTDDVKNSGRMQEPWQKQDVYYTRPCTGKLNKGQSVEGTGTDIVSGRSDSANIGGKPIAVPAAKAARGCARSEYYSVVRPFPRDDGYSVLDRGTPSVELQSADPVDEVTGYSKLGDTSPVCDETKLYYNITQLAPGCGSILKNNGGAHPINETKNRTASIAPGHSVLSEGNSLYANIGDNNTVTAGMLNDVDELDYITVVPNDAYAQL